MNQPLNSECCICLGITTIFSAGSAFVVSNGKEYRLHYHKSCLTPETKKNVEEKLHKLVQADTQEQK